jgi:hypothetical protein
MCHYDRNELTLARFIVGSIPILDGNFEISAIRITRDRLKPRVNFHSRIKEQLYVGNNHYHFSNPLVIWLLWSCYHTGHTANREYGSHYISDRGDPGHFDVGAQAQVKGPQRKHISQ